jgi:hypothetical protein
VAYIDVRCCERLWIRIDQLREQWMWLSLIVVGFIVQAQTHSCASISLALYLNPSDATFSNPKHAQLYHAAALFPSF